MRVRSSPLRLGGMCSRGLRTFLPQILAQTRRSENTYRRNNAKTLALCADYAPNVSQGTIFRRSRRRSQRRGLTRALRRRAGGSAEPVVEVEAGARLSEETARKGGQRREISADVRMCICDKRTKIYRFIDEFLFGGSYYFGPL